MTTQTTDYVSLDDDERRWLADARRARRWRLITLTVTPAITLTAAAGAAAYLQRRR